MKCGLAQVKSSQVLWINKHLQWSKEKSLLIVTPVLLLQLETTVFNEHVNFMHQISFCKHFKKTMKVNTTLSVWDMMPKMA